jgi:hypothetical protein
MAIPSSALLYSVTNISRFVHVHRMPSLKHILGQVNTGHILHALVKFKAIILKSCNIRARDSTCYQQSEKCNIICVRFLTRTIAVPVPSSHTEASDLLQENDCKVKINSKCLLFLCWEKSNHIYNRNGSTECHEERRSISQRSRFSSDGRMRKSRGTIKILASSYLPLNFQNESIKVST